MLGEEAVPRADSVLASLAKHLEVKLAFGATGTQMKAKLKGWTLINPLWFWVQMRTREIWLSSGMTSASDIPPGSWRPNTSAWSCMATRTASPPWPRLWDTQQPLLLACCWMVNLLKYQFVLTFVKLTLVYVARVNVWSKCYANANLSFTFLLGEITRKGLVVPMTKEIYGPVLTRLKEEGLHFRSMSTLQEWELVFYLTSTNMWA